MAYAGRCDATRLVAELGLVSVVQSRKCLLSEAKRNDAWTDHFSEAGLQLASPFPVHVNGWSAHVPVPISAEGPPTDMRCSFHPVLAPANRRR